MAFTSVPGMNYDGSRNRQAPVNDNAREFYESRKRASHDATGFTAGDEILFRGDAARVLHEEKDAHSGVVSTYIQRSAHGDSGIYKIEWEGTHERGMIASKIRRSM